MPLFERASRFTITDSNLVSNDTVMVTTNVVNNGMSELYQHAARGASHDSKDQYEKPKCHPDTRKQLLSDLHEWIKVPEKETGIIFLHGPAGSGKSCIARSACEQAASEGLLGASFFFWRSSSTRNNESRLITTLAYQLAEGNSDLKYHILSVISEDPRIVEMPLEIQFRKLILEPCSKVPRENLHARVIVIDGLDECMGEQTQIGILQMLSKAVRYEGFPIGFFVTSRPELHLQEVLDSKEIIFATNVISLNRIKGVSQDIRTFLESGFSLILNNPRFRRVMKSVPRPWPTSENIEQLVRRSSGQFIYSATVLKFVSDLDKNPASQLEIVLRIRDSGNSSALADLDLLYSEIMSRVSDQELTLKVLGYVMAMQSLVRSKNIKDLKLKFSPVVTRAILYNQNRLLLVVEQLLRLSEGMAYHALNQLHSLISLNVTSESTRRQLKIEFYHKSFQDFLTTKKRSRTFYTNLRVTHNKIVESCFEFMSRPRYETEAHHVGWIYSRFQWHVHLPVSYLGDICVNDYDIALQRCFSEVHDHLNLSTLNRALELLGLSSHSLTSEITEHACDNIDNYGLLSMKNLMHLVNEVFKTHFQKVFFQYTFPIWRTYFQTYIHSDPPVFKQLLLLCLTGGDIFSREEFTLPETEKYKTLQKLGLTSEENESSVISQLDEISRLNLSWGRLLSFLESVEYSGPFHCTPKDFSIMFAAIITSAFHYVDKLFMEWRYSYEKIFITGPVLESLESAALSCLHDDGNIKYLTSEFEDRLLDRLRKYKAVTPNVIGVWQQAFAKARSLYPEQFK